MMERTRQDASLRTQKLGKLSVPFALLAISLVVIAALRIESARADLGLPNKFKETELQPSLASCIDRTGKKELCDTRHLENDPTKSGSGRLKVLHDDIDDELNELRVESLQDEIDFDIPGMTRPSWFFSVGTHLGGLNYDDNDYEISADPARNDETKKIRAGDEPGVATTGTWAMAEAEFTPRLPFGYNPHELEGDPLRNMVSELIPKVEWNIYETRWHPESRVYNRSSFIDGLKESIHLIAQDAKDATEAVKTYISVDPTELVTKFHYLPGETLELERYGALGATAAPIVELVRFSKIPSLVLGASVSGGFTTTSVFHYYRCSVEVVTDTKSRVIFTRLVNYPEKSWWGRFFSKFVGQTFGFVVGAGGFLDFGPISEDFLIPKWQPISWTRYGVESDSFEVDSSAPPVTVTLQKGGFLKRKTDEQVSVTVAEALRDAYRWGAPEKLFAIAQASAKAGQDLGVVRIEADRRLSKRTSKNEIDLVLEGRARPNYNSDITRTTYQPGAPGTPTSAFSSRQIETEFQNFGQGPHHTISLDIGVRTAAKPGDPVPLPENQQPQSLRMTYQFHGSHATRLEMGDLLTVAQIFANSAVTGKPSPASLAATQAAQLQIAAELAKIEPSTHVASYFYLDMDPTAYLALLGQDRSAEYIDLWLSSFDASVQRPADWDTNPNYRTGEERYEWIRNQVAEGDSRMTKHLDKAWQVMQASLQAQKDNPNDRMAQARQFVAAVKNINPDLYPFAAMARMSGAPSHMFLITQLQVGTGKQMDKISFAAVGNEFQRPITMTATKKTP